MKNIHLIATDKPSRLFKDDNQVLNLHTHSVLKGIFTNGIGSNQHIYITSDEEIKDGDYILETDNNTTNIADKDYYRNEFDFKIILTTDQDLIKDGVQAIDNEFLEWFVKNPSCEEVEVEDLWNNDNEFTHSHYEIIIPKEEPKQETVEEASKKYVDNHKDVSQFLETYIVKSAFHDGAKWQQKRMYSEEEIERVARDSYEMGRKNILIGVFNKWFEQFKKK
jgi:hypothetical protein